MSLQSATTAIQDRAIEKLSSDVMEDATIGDGGPNSSEAVSMAVGRCWGEVP